ncbi:hypothetical protein P12x_000612 [Tundrisphaera lichenicola]|uniref:hypothetical protein n=1 Tax=Tundrisphaera lichenicola TaxID=2029860 RepID=UPI003EB8F99A
MNRGNKGNLPSLLAVVLVSAGFAGASHARAGDGPRSLVAIDVDRPMSPPSWALLERQLLRANEKACSEFFARYFDERGYLDCVERWGGDDGPDDASENFTDWTILHAIGASDSVLLAYKKGWEGHLRQFTAAKTKEVPFAREGMYFKEFPVMFDWLHNGEGLNPFQQQGLSDPGDVRFRHRVIRYAGFYLNEDPGAPNYDPEHKLIRSLFNGSRGPLLRKATAVDWAGDPIEVVHRFKPRHGEDSYDQMLEHFKDYNDIVGDHPENLVATCLPLNAYMLTHEGKYKDWLIAYMEAWRRRMIDNGGIIPTNIGLDGKIGSDADGKWYGGVYGWGFTVIDPATRKPVHRNLHHLGLIGFGNVYLLTGDDRFLEPWRRQIDKINAQMKIIDDKPHYPTMYGDQGWYNFTPQAYRHGASEIAFWSMRAEDLARVSEDPWFAFLDGKNPGYPEQALVSDLQSIRQKVAGMRLDDTTPDTRLADDPLSFNPATINSLIHLTLGGLPIGNQTNALHARVRYFDPVARRAGLPPDVAALVEGMSAEETILTLVNVDQSDPREVIVHAGTYAEHQWESVLLDGKSIPIDGPDLTVRLAPGSGASLKFRVKRYANPPTLAFPWD